MLLICKNTILFYKKSFLKAIENCENYIKNILKTDIINLHHIHNHYNLHILQEVHPRWVPHLR